MADDLTQRREAADMHAMIRALTGPQMPESAPYNSFDARFAGDVYPLYNQNVQYTIPGPAAMFDPLINMGIWQRHQGMFPPAQYPQQYDFTNQKK